MAAFLFLPSKGKSLSRRWANLVQRVFDEEDKHESDGVATTET